MAVLTLVLDFLMLVLLGATLYFGVKLSAQLYAFRQGREDFERILYTLSSHIMRAEQAITGLRASTEEEGRQLQRMIDRARGLSDELQLIHAAGDSLAERLEKLAGQARAGSVSSSGDAEPLPRFSIRDMDQEREEEPEDEEPDQTALSKAERDLVAALSSRTSSRRGGV